MGSGRDRLRHRRGARLRRLALGVLLAALPPASVAGEWTPPRRPDDAASAPVVWDAEPGSQGLPRNFRSCDDAVEVPNGLDLAGLRPLRASGSGQFTAAGLAQLRARLPKPVTVFDLRQESHVFVDGTPVSWYATNNWANAERGHDEVLADERARVTALLSTPEVVIADDRAQKGRAAAGAPQRVAVHEAATEQALVEAAGLDYVRIEVSDHARPSDEEVDRFVLAVRALAPGSWVHFHCRAGRGRTTTFLVLYDMLRNADRVRLEDIAKRQELLARDYDVLRPAPDGSWKAPYVADRIAFVRVFYAYARANPGGGPLSWREWLAGRVVRGAQ